LASFLPYIKYNSNYLFPPQLLLNNLPSSIFHRITNKHFPSYYKQVFSIVFNNLI